MMELCLDASVIVKLLFKGESHRVTARRLVKNSLDNHVAMIAPPFFESEADTAVRKRVFAGTMTAAEGKQAFRYLDQFDVQLISTKQIRQRARYIAEQFNQRTVYDSVYAALAELRGCDLWTADKQFYDAVRGKLKFVKFLPDYP
jgi:predicted nucleic acid-binding protein